MVPPCSFPKGGADFILKIAHLKNTSLTEPCNSQAQMFLNQNCKTSGPETTGKEVGL